MCTRRKQSAGSSLHPRVSVVGHTGGDTHFYSHLYCVTLHIFNSHIFGASYLTSLSLTPVCVVYGYIGVLMHVCTPLPF